jgi:sarcosine oxidase subunit beta
MSREYFDVIIVGGGVMGSSIAYHAALQGVRVLVIERAESAVEPAASWASAGGVRRQGRHPAEAQLASVAIAHWPSLEQELAADMHYRQGGNLLVAENEVEAASLLDFVREQQANGFADVVLLDRQQVRELVPGIAQQVVAGSFSPADGQADPILTTRAFAAAAQRHGAMYWNATTVTALQVDGWRVTGVQTSRGAVTAAWVVLSAGAWSDELAATAGLRLPIRTVALQMVLSTPAPARVLRPVVSAVNRMLSLKQRPDGSFLLGGGWPGEVAADRRSYRLRPQSVTGNWETACAILPAVAEQQIARAWCGLEAESIDEIPFVGSISGLDGLLLAVGFSGHGFALSPAIGQSITNLLLGKNAPELSGLSPDRISTFEKERIEAFLSK